MADNYENIKIEKSIQQILKVPFCETNGILPIEIRDDKLILLATEPDSPATKITINTLKSKYNIELEKVSGEQVQAIIDYNYYGKCKICGKKLEKYKTLCNPCAEEERKKQHPTDASTVSNIETTNYNNNLIVNFDSKGENILKDNISNNEKLLVKLKGIVTEGLVITEKRIYILKWGFLVMGACLSFDFKNITGIEIDKASVTGTFEVLTPSTQKTRSSLWASNNIITFSSDKFHLFQEAANIARDLIADHSNQAHNQHNELDQLEKLAELKDKGIITEVEFNIKKKQILGI
jgi:hypothetical protein